MPAQPRFAPLPVRRPAPAAGRVVVGDSASSVDSRRASSRRRDRRGRRRAPEHRAGQCHRQGIGPSRSVARRPRRLHPPATGDRAVDAPDLGPDRGLLRGRRPAEGMRGRDELLPLLARRVPAPGRRAPDASGQRRCDARRVPDRPGRRAGRPHPGAPRPVALRRSLLRARAPCVERPGRRPVVFDGGYGTDSRSQRFWRIRRVGQKVAEPAKSSAPAANTFAPAGVS